MGNVYIFVSVSEFACSKRKQMIALVTLNSVISNATMHQSPDQVEPMWPTPYIAKSYVIQI